MLPIVHAALGLVLAGFLLPFVGWLNALILFMFSVFIDVDHNLYCGLYNKKWGFNHCYWWHRNDKARDELHVFHTVEVWTVIIIAGMLNELWFFASIGLMLHMLIDFLELQIKKLYGRRSISAITWMARRINL